MVSHRSGVYVCVCVCLCVYVYVCVCVCMCVCVCVCVCVQGYHNGGDTDSQSHAGDLGQIIVEEAVYTMSHSSTQSTKHDTYYIQCIPLAMMVS